MSDTVVTNKAKKNWTPDNWTDGLAPSELTAIGKKTGEARAAFAKSDAYRVRGAEALRVVRDRYFKGDKARFAAYAASEFGLSKSSAYLYVQAAEAKKKAPAATQGVTDITALAYLDRFEANVIPEVVKAAEGTNKAAMQKAAESVVPSESDKAKARADAEAEAATQDRDTSRAKSLAIQKKLRDKMRQAVATCEAIITEGDTRKAITTALILGAKWSKDHGAETQDALTALYAEWSRELKAEAEAKAKAEAEAESLKAQAESLKPTPRKRTPKAKAEPTPTPTPKAPRKRTPRPKAEAK